MTTLAGSQREESTLRNQEFDMLINLFKTTRNQTLELVQPLEIEDYVVQTAYFMSPPKWHIGHVSWFYEVLLSKLKDDYNFYSDEFSKVLNSYYRSQGEPWDKGKRGVLSRPTVTQIKSYFDEINNRVTGFLREQKEQNNSNSIDNTLFMFKMGINHECQHQELLVYDLQHLLASYYTPVRRNDRPKPSPTVFEDTSSSGKIDSTGKKMIKIDGGLFKVGYNGNDYCYDIELPEHNVYLEPYAIDAFPVTNDEFMKFVEDGGYENFEYWLADGWDKIRENGWKCPMYWEKGEDGKWYIHDFLGKRLLNPNEPVCNISYYEAYAYCKWEGKRLPTEAEWEKAACWDEKKQEKTIYPWGNKLPYDSQANLLESRLWLPSEIGSYPEGKSPSGCHHMIGDVWEWTSSEYEAYPRFKSKFFEYNDKWFANQKVLRGGSFATPRISIRGSYRNFFKLDERWMFAGLRCAEYV